MSILSFNPVFTTPQIVVAAGAAVFAVALANRKAASGSSIKSRQHRLLTALRIAVIVAIGILLLNPVMARTNSNSEKPPLLILFDSSRSMATKDVDGRRRFDAAKTSSIEDVELMNRLSEQFTCRLFSVGDGAAPQNIASFLHVGAPSADRTFLGESIETALASTGAAPSGGMLLISDGRNNGDVNPLQTAALAKSRRFPIFTVCLGDTKQAPDVAVINHRPQMYAVPEQRLTLSAEISSTGYGGQSASVDLMREGKTLQTQTVRLDDRRPAPVSFGVAEKNEGTFRYMFAVHPMPGETILSNNRSSVLLQVLKAQTRVLVLEGRPTWDARFFIKALRSDPSIQVDSIYKITSDKIYATQGTTGLAGTLHVPKSSAEFARYDVIVIGKGYEDLFDSGGAEALKDYVSNHAGNLIFLRGKPEERADTLRALEPVQWSSDQIDDVRMQITAEGELNPAFNFRGGQDPQMIVQKLPSLISATRVQGEKALTVVLARASNVDAGSPNREMAVVAYQNYGQGKVLSLVGEGLWRWALLPPELKDYTDCYTDFWTQLIRWMVNQSDFLPGQDLSLKTDHTNYGSGDIVRLLAYSRGRASAPLPPVAITGPDGKTTQLALEPSKSKDADFTAAFQPKQAGEYVAAIMRPHVGAVVAPFSVYPEREEDRITAADPELMSQIARAGGGETITLDQLKQLPKKLHDARATLSDTTQARSAWDTGWALALVLAMISAEWILRRRFGLV